MASWVSKRPLACATSTVSSPRRERGLDLPVRHRDEGPALELALDDEAQRGRLHAADGEVVGAEAIRGQRHEAREHRAPDEVDVLARVRRLGQVEVDGGRLGEGGLDLVLGEGGVAHAHVPVDDGGRHHGLDVRVAVVGRLGRRLRGGRGLAAPALLLAGARLVVRVALERVAAQDLERLVPDELALAVVVGGDDELGGALGRAAQRRQRAGGAAVDDPREVGVVDHLTEVLEAPAAVPVGEDRSPSRGRAGRWRRRRRPRSLKWYDLTFWRPRPCSLTMALPPPRMSAILRAASAFSVTMSFTMVPHVRSGAARNDGS